MANQISRLVHKLDKLPPRLRQKAQTLMLGTMVPFLGTAGVEFEEVSEDRVVVRIKNRRKAQNHIKGVHAAAMALLAETATGFALGIHLPDDKLPLIKSMKVDYQKRSTGDMRAVATLRPEQVAAIRSEDKGQVTVPVEIRDESGEEPIACEMIWAWVPKKKH